MAKSTGSKRKDAEALAALERFGGAPSGKSVATRSKGGDSGELEFATPLTTKKAPRVVRNEEAVARVPRWYHFAVPILFSVGGLLVIIGLWAVGAMVYMHTVTPSGPDFEVQYPLIRWSADLGDAGGYTAESKMMAVIMLACLPVAVIMGGMVMLMRRQMRLAGEGGDA